MPDYSGQTVREILKGKRGTIKDAALPRGSPSWDDILDLPWEEVLKRATKRAKGFQQIKKLLNEGRFDK